MIDLARITNDLGGDEETNEPWQRALDPTTPPYHLTSLQDLVLYIESDPDAAKWEALLTPEERAQQRYPGGYAYTHQVIVPAALALVAQRIEPSPSMRVYTEFPDPDYWSAEQLMGAAPSAVMLIHGALGLEGQTNSAEVLIRYHEEIKYLHLSDESNFEALAAVGELPQLTHVMLSEMGPQRLIESLRWCVRQPRFTALCIDLYRCPALDASQLDALPSPSNLTRLKIALGECDPQLMEQLCAWLPFDKLHHLDLYDRPPQDHPSTDLLTRINPKHTPQLRHLKITNSSRLPVPANFIAALEGLQLESYSTYSTTYTTQDIEALTKVLNTSDLQSLELRHAALDDASALTLTQAQWPALCELNFEGNYIQREGMFAIANAMRDGSMRSVEELSFYDNSIHIDHIEEFREEFTAQLSRSGEDCFGELRSILQPGYKGWPWHELTKRLERWPDAEHLEQVVIPYALAHLRSLPDHERQMTKSMKDRLALGQYTPELRLVRAAQLDNYSYFDLTQSLFKLAQVEELRELKELEIKYSTLTEAQGQQLANAPNLQGLRRLSLQQNWGADEARGAYAMLRHAWPALRSLRLDGYNMELEEAKLCDSPWVAQLEVLELDCCAIFEPQLIYKTPPQWRTLHLENITLSDEAIDELERFERLTHLRIYRGQLDIARLLSQPFIARLDTLSISEHNLNEDQLQRLIARDDLRLKTLELSGAGIDAATATQLFNTPWFRELETLNLSYNQLGSSTQRLFESSKNASLKLRHLSLEYAGHPKGEELQSEQLSALAQCAWLSELRTLNIKGNGLTGTRGFKDLLRSPYLKDPTELRFGYGLTHQERAIIQSTPSLPAALRHYADHIDEDDLEDEPTGDAIGNGEDTP